MTAASRSTAPTAARRGTAASSSSSAVRVTSSVVPILVLAARPGGSRRWLMAYPVTSRIRWAPPAGLPSGPSIRNWMQLQTRSLTGPPGRLLTSRSSTGVPVASTRRSDRSIEPASIWGSTSPIRRPGHPFAGRPPRCPAASLAQTIRSSRSKMTTQNDHSIRPIGVIACRWSGVQVTPPPGTPSRPVERAHPVVLMSAPGRPDRVGGDDRLVGVVGGLDLLQAAVGGGREHSVGADWSLGEVVVVVGRVPGSEGVLDGLGLGAHRVARFGGGGEATGEHDVVGVDFGLGSAAWDGARQRAAEGAGLDGG